MKPDQVETAYKTDMPMGQLSTVEALIVTSFRLWAAPHREPEATHPVWKTGLHVAGVAPWGLHAFDTLLWVTLASGAYPLDVRCHTSTKLGRDEAHLLKMLAMCQAGTINDGVMPLSLWMPCFAAQTALVHLQLFAVALCNAGLSIDPVIREARNPNHSSQLGQKPTPHTLH
tara:strand:+ start:17398 stop:17913 length:516 start_codon:yes stop_codon:yes gene_type:complete